VSVTQPLRTISNEVQESSHRGMNVLVTPVDDARKALKCDTLDLEALQLPLSQFLSDERLRQQCDAQSQLRELFLHFEAHDLHGDIHGETALGELLLQKTAVLTPILVQDPGGMPQRIDSDLPAGDDRIVWGRHEHDIRDGEGPSAQRERVMELATDENDQAKVEIAGRTRGRISAGWPAVIETATLG
jgi:hypothetical protein